MLRNLGGFLGSSDGKASTYNVGDLGSIPELERSPREGNGNPLQYSCLGNPMDGGAWWATVHGVAKSQTRLSMHAATAREVPGLQELSTSLPLTAFSILPSPGFCLISLLPTWWVYKLYNPSPDFVNKALLEHSAPLHVCTVRGGCFLVTSAVEQVLQRS